MSKNNFLIALLITLVMILSGCSEENTTEPPPTITAPLSKLSDIQTKVFNTSCALSGCHGSTNTQANLLLIEGSSHSSLVDVPSILHSGLRVEKFNSSNSVLIKMLNGDLNPRMPYNRDKLPQPVIDSIAKWISKGALND